ncbi:MAG: methionine biosynthesis protein MetW, partial [bacterium]|nr:methionine biosynthesis protein MetW [bacterium]
EVADYPDNAFDYVILSQTMQQVYEPSSIIRSMLRVGKKGIVSFPNFCHWKIRMQMCLTGYVPVTKELPYKWYNTPNIRVLSITDFRKYSKEIGFEILKEVAISPDKNNAGGKIVKFIPNLFATYGIFQIGNKDQPIK